MKEVAFFLKAFLIPAFCYLPAFGLVWLSSNVFKPTTANTQISEMGTLEKQVETEVKKQLNLRRAVPQGELQKQISDEVKKATREEIENQENKVKGDLFGQISFPVLFAISSIFAAFAVKDILTEILKEQEKDKIKQELRQELIPMISEAVENNPSLSQRILAVETYTRWLEHELLNIAVHQTFDELHKSLGSSFEEIRENLGTIEKLLNRSKATLYEVGKSRVGGFKESNLELLQEAELAIFQAKVKSIGLEEKMQNYLLLKLSEAPVMTRKNQSDLVQEDPNSRMDEIFQMQIDLLISTLKKLPGSDVLVNSIRDRLSRDEWHEDEEEKINELINRKPHKRPPLDG